MFFVERDHMIEDFPPTSSHPPLATPVLPSACTLVCLACKPVAFKKVITSASYFESRSKMAYRYGPDSGKASRNCCTTHSAVGCRVTLKCRIFRRPCSMTKKQCNSLNVTDGTAKKSKATITSR